MQMGNRPSSDDNMTKVTTYSDDANENDDVFDNNNNSGVPASDDVTKALSVLLRPRVQSSSASYSTPPIVASLRPQVRVICCSFCNNEIRDFYPSFSRASLTTFTFKMSHNQLNRLYEIAFVPMASSICRLDLTVYRLFLISDTSKLFSLIFRRANQWSRLVID